MTEHPTDKELDELATLEAKATPGPVACSQSDDGGLWFWSQDNHDSRNATEADARLVAAARNALPRLIAALREAREWWKHVAKSADEMSAILDRTGACLAGIPMETLAEAARRVVRERDAALKERDALRAEVERLMGLVDVAGNDDRRGCRWCDGGEIPFPGAHSADTHSADCPAFTPDGTVRRGEKP